MKKTIVYLAILALIISLSSCFSPFHSIRGTGQLITDTLLLDDITGIEVEDIINVVLTKSDTQQVIIEAQSNIIDLVDIYVSNGICHIKFKDKHNVQPTRTTTLYISSSTIESIVVDGTGDVTTTNTFDTLTNINIEVNGTGDIQFDWMFANDIFIEIDGTGDVDLYGDGNDLRTKIAGTGELQMHTNLLTSRFELDGTGDCFINGSTISNHIDIDGTGDFYGFNFETENSSVNIDGSGNAEVFASENLTVDIDGSGNVIYRGFPNIVFSSDGSGNLINGN